MKTIETSKGKFEIIEMVGEENAMILVHAITSGDTYYKLLKMTEEQASNITGKKVNSRDDLYRLLESHNIEITPNTYIFKV